MKLLNVSILCLGMLPALSFGKEVPAEKAVEKKKKKTSLPLYSAKMFILSEWEAHAHVADITVWRG